MMYGYANCVLRVDLSKGNIKKEELKEKYARNYLGGRGIATRILYEEVPKGIEPLSAANKLIFMTGPLTGTLIPTAGRYDVVAKSPLTGVFGAASSGGHFGAELKFAGYDGIIVEGASSKPVYLFIDDDEVSIKSAEDFWGRTVHETEEMIKEEIGDVGVKVANIGPAGENLVKFAAIMNDSTRAAGRTGMGAVMGSKKLKAIAVRGSKDVIISDYKGLMEMLSGRIKEIGRYEALSIAISTFGTPGMVSYIHAIGGFPTHNYAAHRFNREEAEKIDQESVREGLVIKKGACFGCTIGCGRVSRIPSGKYADELGEGPEYEHINTLGGRCGCSDLNLLMKAHNLCNELGMDGISAGATIGMAMECYEDGLLTKNDTDGIELRWGNAEAVVEMLKKIAMREGIGDVLAEGSRGAAAKIGKGAEKYAIHIKGLEPAGYEPRSMKGVALSFATANRGADHLGSTFTVVDFGMPVLIVPISVDPLDFGKEKVEPMKEMEEWMQVMDSAVICKFYGLNITQEQLTQFVNLVTGWDISIDDLRLIGERIWNIQRVYSIREGLRGREDDRWPDRLYEEPLPAGPAKGEVIQKEIFEQRLSDYYKIRGWNERGIPTKEKLKELEIGFEVEE